MSPVKTLDVGWIKGTVVEQLRDGWVMVEIADENGKTIALLDIPSGMLLREVVAW